MILIEQTQVPDGALPVAEFRDHLQLGSGFADDGLQDGVLVPQLRAAIATVEGKTGKALLSRSFKLVVAAWRDMDRQVLPLAPVSAVTALSITDLSDEVEIVAPARYCLRKDAHAPVIYAMGLSLPTIPVGGTAEIEFDAGFGDWAKVPDDLRQAVMMLAAHYYEIRTPVAQRATELPLSIAAICRRHAPMRLVGVRRP